jgi:hypothetical protein
MIGYGPLVLSVAVSLGIAGPALAQLTLILPEPGGGYPAVPPMRQTARTCYTLGRWMGEGDHSWQRTGPLSWRRSLGL